jgi:hypothetical protein
MRVYPGWWRRNFLGVEFGICVLATLCLFVWARYGRGLTLVLDLVRNNRGQIYGTLASISGSLLGFVIATLSIVLALTSTGQLKVLKRSKYYRQLWTVFTSAIRYLGLTTFLWLIALFFDRESAQKPYLFIGCLGLTLLAIARLVRCVWVLERIVETLTVVPQDGEGKSN